jgi:uncharacterized protein
MNTALIVLAKAPVARQAKTRLAPALGDEGAAALALRLLDHAVDQAALAAAALPASLELCVTPSREHPAFTRLAAMHGLQLTSQGEGDLGARMHRALSRALRGAHRALLMGTDAPALDAAMLTAATQALDGADAVFIPALDGGYALVGLRAPAAALFEGMAWSTPGVMQATRERARAAGLRLAELAPVADIDEPADLVHLPPAWRAALLAFAQEQNHEGAKPCWQ